VILPAFIRISDFVTYHKGRTQIEDVLNIVLTDVFGTEREETR
jgi:hypothetical protein